MAARKRHRRSKSKRMILARLKKAWNREMLNKPANITNITHEARECGISETEIERLKQRAFEDAFNSQFKK